MQKFFSSHFNGKYYLKFLTNSTKTIQSLKNLDTPANHDSINVHCTAKEIKMNSLHEHYNTVINHCENPDNRGSN